MKTRMGDPGRDAGDCNSDMEYEYPGFATEICPLFSLYPQNHGRLANQPARKKVALFLALLIDWH